MNATTNLASLVKANLSTDIIRMNGSSNSLILNNDISAWIKSQKNNKLANAAKKSGRSR